MKEHTPSVAKSAELSRNGNQSTEVAHGLCDQAMALGKGVRVRLFHYVKSLGSKNMSNIGI